MFLKMFLHVAMAQCALTQPGPMAEKMGNLISVSTALECTN